MGKPTLIVVSGPPGAGKTTLAHALATGVGCPAICRDEIKEGMVQAAPGYVPSPSDDLALRTYRTFFDTIELLLRAEATLIAEAAFQDSLWRQGLEPLTGLAHLRVLVCTVASDVARARQRQRLENVSSRAAHADHDQLSGTTAFVGLSLDVPRLEVDTTAGYRPSLDQIAAFAVRTGREPIHSGQ